jgi:hypothetical protein
MDAPDDAPVTPFKSLELPASVHGARRLDEDGLPLLLRDTYFEYRGHELPWSDTSLISERITAIETPSSRSAPRRDLHVPHMIYANRDVPLSAVDVILQSVARARAGTQSEFRLVMAKSVADYRPYELPAETPESVKILHRDFGDMHGAGEYEQAMVRANTSCAPFSSALTDVYGFTTPLSSAGAADRLIEAIEACQCRGVDVEVAAGLLLAANAHVSPFAWWPVSSAPVDGTRTVQLPGSATVAGLVAEIAKDPQGRAVHLVVKEPGRLPGDPTPDDDDD